MLNLFRKHSRKDDMKEVQKFLREHLRQIQEKKDVIPSDVFDVTTFFIEETIEIYESLGILIHKNHLRGCIPLSRSIFEHSINLQYIYESDTEQRAKNFKLAAIDNFLKRYANRKSKHPVEKEIKKMMQDQLKDYVPDKTRIADRMKKVRSSSAHKEAYGRLSEYVHSGYRTERSLDDGGRYVDHLKRIVFSDSLLVTLEALQQVCERYDLDGEYIVIEEPAYDATIFYHTNLSKVESDTRV